MSSSDNGNSNISNKDIEGSKSDAAFKRKAAIFLASVTGLSALFGFGATLVSVRRQDPKYFNKGMIGSIEMTETGASLALRALGLGSLYAFTGCGVLFFAIWKLSGIQTMEELRNKMSSAVPKIPRNNPPQGRTEFSGLNDLLEYLAQYKSRKEE